MGNARTFLITWALARSAEWRILLRIEDLDTPRVKPAAVDATISTLRWLGMDWDDGPEIQSANPEPYRAAMESLARAGVAYPSDATRSQVEAASSAPQEGVHETPFPRSMRPALESRAFDEPGSNWRFATPEGAVSFDDAFAGPQRRDPAATVGDFVIWTKRGQAAYQLAVVVDDHRRGVTDVVRGDDLLDSAARQLLLYRALGHAPEPAYLHLPLVRGDDGRRLAKRHGDTRLETYRAAGVPPERVVGLVAWWSGAAPRRAPMSAAEFRGALDLSRVPRKDVMFTREDHEWLLRC